MPREFWLTQAGQYIVTLTLQPRWRITSWTLVSGTTYQVSLADQPWDLLVAGVGDLTVNGVAYVLVSGSPAPGQWSWDGLKRVITANFGATNPNASSTVAVLTLRVLVATEAYDGAHGSYLPFLVDTPSLRWTLNEIFDTGRLASDDVQFALARTDAAAWAPMARAARDWAWNNAPFVLRLVGRPPAPESEAVTLARGYVVRAECLPSSIRLYASDARARYAKQVPTQTISQTDWPEAPRPATDPIVYGTVDDAAGVVLTDFALFAEFVISSADASADKYVYYSHALNTQYTVVSGDYLEYFITWHTSGARIGVDLQFTDGSYLRTVNPSDQSGYRSHPATAIPDSLVFRRIYRRRFSLSGVVGKTVQAILIACENDVAGTYSASISWIAITDGAGTVRRVLYGRAYRGAEFNARVVDLRIDNPLERMETTEGDTPAVWTHSLQEGALYATGGSQAVCLLSDVEFENGLVRLILTRAYNAGVVFRYKDKSNYYLIALSDDSGLTPMRNVRVLRRSAGTFTQLAAADIAWTAGTAKTFQVWVAGSTIRVYVDGALTVDVTDTTPITGVGRVGLRNDTGSATFFGLWAVNSDWTLAFTSHAANAATLLMPTTWVRLASHPCYNVRAFARDSGVEVTLLGADMRTAGVAAIATSPDRVRFAVQGRMDSVGALITRPGAVLVDFLTLIGVPSSEIDLAAMSSLDTARPYDLAFQLTQPTDALAVVRTIEESVLAFTASDDQGRVTVVPYTSGDPSGTATAVTDDEVVPGGLQFDPTYRRLVLEYARSYVTGEPRRIERDIAMGRYISQSEIDFPPIATYLRNEADARTIAALYASLLSQTRTHVLAQTHPQAAAWRPFQKFRLTAPAWGLANLLVWLRDMRFDPLRGLAQCELVEDRTLHADETAHSDTAHSDAAVHGDAAHSDLTTHNDTAHSDVVWHDDAAHTDSTTHSDIAHSDHSDHSDTAHSDYSDHLDHSDTWP